MANDDLERIEPPAALRKFASTLRQTYAALVLEGFSTDEALTLIGHILAASSGGPK